MKRILEFLIIIAFVTALVGCGAKTRKDDFFSKEELKNLYLEDLPKINYSTSFLKIYVGTLEGYFNVKKVFFENSFLCNIFLYSKKIANVIFTIVFAIAFVVKYS